MSSNIPNCSRVCGAAHIAATILPSSLNLIAISFTLLSSKLSAPGSPPGKTIASYSSWSMLSIIQSDCIIILCVPLTNSSFIEHKSHFKLALTKHVYY